MIMIMKVIIYKKLIKKNCTSTTWQVNCLKREVFLTNHNRGNFFNIED